MADLIVSGVQKLSAVSKKEGSLSGGICPVVISVQEGSLLDRGTGWGWGGGGGGVVGTPIHLFQNYFVCFCLS